MTNLTDSRKQLAAYIELLRVGADFGLTAQIRTANPGEDPCRPELVVELAGPDAPLLTERDGELLHAIEHIAAKILRLEPEEHHRIFFDANGFRTRRDAELKRLATSAVLEVRTTSTAYVFPPMMSRERRLLHLELASSGLKTASSGEHFHRSVVLYPDDVNPPAG